MKDEFLIVYARIVLFVVDQLEDYLEETPSQAELAALVMEVFNAIFGRGSLFELQATIEEAGVAVNKAIGIRKKDKKASGG